MHWGWFWVLDRDYYCTKDRCCGNIQVSQLEPIASTQEVYSGEERLCLPNAGGGGDFTIQLMCGDFPLLFLKDASSKDYACQAVFRHSL